MMKSHSDTLWVFANGITQKDREIFNMIFEHTGAGCTVSFIDVDLQDVDIETRNAVVAVGGKALKAIIADIKDKKLYDIKRILGYDFTDTENKFFLYNIPYTFQEMISSTENKKDVWGRIQRIAGTHKDFFGDIKKEEVDKETESTVKEDPKEDSSVKKETGRLSFDTQEVWQKLVDSVATNDPSVSKSLAKYEKIIMNCSNGRLTVYPTNRIPEEDTSSISIKDLIVLLRISEVLDVRNFSFEQGHGLSLSN